MEPLTGAELASMAQSLADDGLSETEASVACGYYSEKDGQKRPALLRFLRALMQAGVSIAFQSKRSGGAPTSNHIRVTKLGQLVVGPRFTRSISGTGDLYEVTHTEDFGQIVLTKVQPEVAEELILGGKVRKQRTVKPKASREQLELPTEPAAAEPALVA